MKTEQETKDKIIEIKKYKERASHYPYNGTVVIEYSAMLEVLEWIIEKKHKE